MDDAFTVYNAAMKGLLGPGWWSTWPLATRHSVGDVCTLVGGQLLRAGSLGSLGVRRPTRTSPYRDRLTYDSNGSIAVTFKASGTTGPLFQALSAAEAGAHVAFTRGRSVFAVFAGLRETALAEPHLLARSLVELYFRQQWEPEWAAVTHVLSAEASTVLISDSASAEAELRLGATVGAAAMPQIANLAVDVQLARSSNIGLEWMGALRATPFCRVAVLRKSWLGRIDADFAPRQKAKGLAPADIPSRVLNEALQRPDDVIMQDPAADDVPGGS